MATIPGVILAGGLATRMGGGDKALLPLGDTTMLDHLVDRLRPQCAALALNANGDPGRFARFALPVLGDSVEGFQGPLAGVLAGLDWAAEQGAARILTVAGDTPFVPLDLVERLCQAAGDTRSALALAASPDQTGTMRVHPTIGLWPVILRRDLRADLAAGMRKISLWAERHGAVTATFSSEPFDPFFNVNTAEDLHRAQRIASEMPASR